MSAVTDCGTPRRRVPKAVTQAGTYCETCYEFVPKSDPVFGGEYNTLDGHGPAYYQKSQCWACETGYGCEDYVKERIRKGHFRPDHCAACDHPLLVRVFDEYEGPIRRRRWRSFCSQRCRSHFYRHRDKPPLVVECAGCGEVFRAPRKDARYCSSACRQRAYRRRAAS